MRTKKTNVEIYFGRHSGFFSAVINDMASFDEVDELQGNGKYYALYKLIESKIEDEISEWVSSFF